MPTVTQVVDIGAVMGSVAFASTILVQWIKVLLIDPHTADDGSRVAFLQLVTFLVNLLLLAGFMSAVGKFAPADIPTYLLLAIGGYAGSNGGFQTLKNGSTFGQKSMLPGLPMKGEISTTLLPHAGQAEVGTETPPLDQTKDGDMRG